MNTTTKRSLMAVAVALFVVICAIAFLGIATSNNAANADPTPTIPETKVTFNVTSAEATSGATTLYVDNDNKSSFSVEVTYKIVYNDGFNSILLIPEYDASVFEIQRIVDPNDNTKTIPNITVNNATSLGEATITDVNDPEYDGAIKVAFENAGANTFYDALDGENAFFLTVVFDIIAVPDTTNGHTITYDFGLDLTSSGENAKSVAYYIKDSGEENGEQEEVLIEIDAQSQNTVTLVVKQQAVIEFGSNTNEMDTEITSHPYDYTFVYNKAALGVDKVTSFNQDPDHIVEYTYSGDALVENITVMWYYAAYENDVVVPGGQVTRYDEVLAEDVNTAPIVAGNYVVKVSAPATNAYYAVEEIAYVHIKEKVIVITIANKTSVYGAAIEALTYTNDAPYEGDTLNISLYTVTDDSNGQPVTLEPGTDAGTYRICGSATQTGNYSIQFRGENSQEEYGIYEITKIAITVTAGDQSLAFTGSDLSGSIDQSVYTVQGTIPNGCTVVLTVNGGNEVVNPVQGGYVIAPSISPALSETNYTVQFVNGTLTVTSASEAVLHIRDTYFAGATVVYDKESHNLLSVNNLPDYYHYEASNNWQTNVNRNNDDEVIPYVISVTISIADGYQGLYTIDTSDNDGSYIFTVQGTINPRPVTVTADNKSVQFGAAPAARTSTVTSEYDPAVCEGDNLQIILEVLDTANELDFEPTNSTPVANYTIDVWADNDNYVITLVNGTYSVTKADSVVTVTAQNVLYNRALVITSSASVNTYALDSNLISTTYYDSNNTLMNSVPENVGTYTVRVDVDGTNNYNASYATAEFTISAVQLALPQLSYNGATVTLAQVTEDVGGVALKGNPTLVYTVNNEEVSYSYTADAASNGLTYSVAPVNNNNYLPNESNTVAVYSVQFDEGEHPLVATSATNMPNTMYVFAGQSITIPAAATLHGYTFVSWNGQAVGSSYTPAASVTLPAIWTRGTFTIQFKNLESDEQPIYSYVGQYGDPVTYPTSQVHPTKARQGAISYVFNQKWLYNDILYGVSGSNGTTTVGTSIKGDMTFVAVFVEMLNSSLVTYMFSDNESTAAYTQWGEQQAVVFGDVIEYRTHEEGIAWFKVDGWYSDPERTTPAPTTIGDEDITVYGTYKFNIGLGDVNADGIVNAEDITTYRQWIVGGYDVVTIAAGEEWATVTDNEFDPEAETVYFLRRVADINVDNSLDIRDVSVTRMAMVGGYAWGIYTGRSVTGQEIVRGSAITTLEQLQVAVTGGSRATLGQVINQPTVDVNYTYAGDIYIDLNGKTINVKSFKLSTNVENATITVINGRIVTTDGVEITAPSGNVVLQNLTAYDKEGVIALQAADSSLHFFGEVEFIKAEIQAVADTGAVTIKENTEAVPAPAMIAEGTHVVVEEEADLKVEKIVVYEEVVEQVNEQEVVTKQILEAAAATLSLDVKSATTEPIVVFAVNVTPTIEQPEAVHNDVKVAALVSTQAQLENAIAAGNETIVLIDNVALASTVVITRDVTIDLNGKNITATNARAIQIKSGTVSIIGTGTISANGDALANTSSVIRVGDGSANNAIASLTIGKDVTVSSDKCYGITVFGANVVDANGFGMYLTVNGTVEVSGVSSAISGNGTSTWTATNITINGTAVVKSAIDSAIYQPQHGTLTIKSGAKVEGTTGVYIKSGNVTIEDGVEIKATLAEYAQYLYNGDGNYPTGDAIVIDNCYYPGANATVTLGDNIEDTITVAAAGAKKVASYWAVSNEEQLNAAVAAKATFIALRGNIALTNTIVITSDVTIDLNGKNITATDVRALWIKSGNVEIKGNGTISSIAGNTLVDSSSVIRVGDSANNDVVASLTIGAGVTVSSDRCYGITVFGKNVGENEVGQVLVVNGTVAVTGTASAISGNGNAGLSKANITINSGAIVSATTDAAIYQPQRGNTVIKAGASLIGPTALYIKSGNVTVEDGAILAATKTTYTSYEFYGNGPKSTGDAIVIDNCYYPGANATVTLGDNIEDTITVAAQGASKVATYWYVKTEAQLREAVVVGGVITLANNITVTGTTAADRLAITADTTLDLNGKTIKSADGLEPTGNWSTLWVNNGAVVTIKNGTIGSCYDTNGTTDAPYGITVGVKNGTSGTLNLMNVNVYGGTTAVYVILGTANIYSGTYAVSPYIHDQVEDYNYLINCFDANYTAGTAKINVYGGTYINFDPSNCGADPQVPTNYVAEECRVADMGNDTYLVYHWYVETEAQLREAVAIGGEITLANDITVTGTTAADRLAITADTTLDLNGKTIKSADGLEPTGNWSTLWVNNGAVVTIKNGTIGSCYDTNGTTDAPYGITVGVKNGTSGTLNLMNVNVYGGTTAVYVILGTANIYSGTYAVSPYIHDQVEDYNYLINCWDVNYTAGTAVINVYGGTYTNFDPSNCGADPVVPTNYVVEGYTVTENGNVYTVTKAE